MSSETEPLVRFIQWILSPPNLTSMGTYITTLTFAGRYIWKKLESKQNQDIEALKNEVTKLNETMNDNMKSIQKDMLRIQIITGIESKLLSAPDLTTMYDKYKEMGGNSYISRIVSDYLEEILHERD